MLRVIGSAKYRMPAIIGNTALTSVSTLLNELVACGSASAQLGIVGRSAGCSAVKSASSCSGFKPTSRATARMIERR